MGRKQIPFPVQNRREPGGAFRGGEDESRSERALPLAARRDLAEGVRKSAETTRYLSQLGLSEEEISCGIYRVKEFPNWHTSEPEEPYGSGNNPENDDEYIYVIYDVFPDLSPKIGFRRTGAAARTQPSLRRHRRHPPHAAS
jgi:hypothetical protein